uniref:Uncharacterized protein n=1 Tax=Acrobeloides nanus TaxID=290746 RepID=A0A914CFD0_9BILA
MSPFIYSAVDVIIQFQAPIILTILIQFSTLHSFLNAITMILLMKPYRGAVRDAFRMKCIFNQVSGSNLVVVASTTGFDIDCDLTVGDGFLFGYELWHSSTIEQSINVNLLFDYIGIDLSMK